MPAFLSTEWIAALAEAAARSRCDTTLNEPLRLAVAVDGAVAWHLTIGSGRVTVAAGPAEGASVTIETDRATATGLARGVLNAQAALDAGRLRVSGDLGLLGRARSALECLGDLFAGVREVTTFDAPAA